MHLPVRILVGVIAFLCLTSLCSNYIIINFTFICMQNYTDSGFIQEGNHTRGRYDYKSWEKQAIIWAVGAGTVIGTFPMNYFCVKHGARMPFLIAGLVSNLATGLLPLAAAHSYYILLLLRFVQGFAYSADFAVIGTICVSWSPLDELALFIASLTVFSSIASVVTNSVSGYLCTTSLKWQSSFYLHAIFGMVAFSLWLIFYRDDPTNHFLISKEEITHIQKGKNEEEISRPKRIPYIRIFTSLPIIIVMLNAFVEMSVTIFLITYAPTFFHKVLKFDVDTTGYFLSLSMLFQLPFKYTAGFISDKCRIINDKKKMLVFNTIAVGIPAAVFLLLGFVDIEHRWMAFALLAIFNATSSMNCGAFYKCGCLVARQYASVVIASIQYMKVIALFVAPLLEFLTVHNEEDMSDWRNAFLIIAGSLFLATILAFPTFTDKPAEFTKIENTKSEEKDFEKSNDMLMDTVK